MVVDLIFYTPECEKEENLARGGNAALHRWVTIPLINVSNRFNASVNAYELSTSETGELNANEHRPGFFERLKYVLGSGSLNSRSRAANTCRTTNYCHVDLRINDVSYTFRWGSGMIKKPFKTYHNERMRYNVKRLFVTERAKEKLKLYCEGLHEKNVGFNYVGILCTKCAQICL